jgi:hypothetical protein
MNYTNMTFRGPLEAYQFTLRLLTEYEVLTVTFDTPGRRIRFYAPWDSTTLLVDVRGNVEIMTLNTQTDNRKSRFEDLHTAINEMTGRIVEWLLLREYTAASAAVRTGLHAVVGAPCALPRPTLATFLLQRRSRTGWTCECVKLEIAPT